MSGLGVPVKLLHESLGHVITVELKTGQLYRGKLAEGTREAVDKHPISHDPSPKKTAEDNLNIALKDITVTGRDGRVSQLDQVYIRGSMVRFFIVPDMLQNAPMSVPVHLLAARHSHFARTDHHFPLHRFKRTGVNAMRGRGIGTARGRATIMRGLLSSRLSLCPSLTATFSQCPPWTWHAPSQGHQAMTAHDLVVPPFLLSKNVKDSVRITREMEHLVAVCFCYAFFVYIHNAKKNTVHTRQSKETRKSMKSNDIDKNDRRNRQMVQETRLS